jgi:hypothetical protein
MYLSSIQERERERERERESCGWDPQDGHFFKVTAELISKI